MCIYIWTALNSQFEPISSTRLNHINYIQRVNIFFDKIRLIKNFTNTKKLAEINYRQSTTSNQMRKNIIKPALINTIHSLNTQRNHRKIHYLGIVQKHHFHNRYLQLIRGYWVEKFLSSHKRSIHNGNMKTTQTRKRRNRVANTNRTVESYSIRFFRLKRGFALHIHT